MTGRASGPDFISRETGPQIVSHDHGARANFVGRQPSMQRFSPVQFSPGDDGADDDASLLAAAAKVAKVANTIFHPVASCKMGRADDAMAVAGQRLRVIGLDVLRIAGASFMPSITSGNTHAPAMMIAGKAAAMILQDRQRR